MPKKTSPIARSSGFRLSAVVASLLFLGLLALEVYQVIAQGGWPGYSPAVNVPVLILLGVLWVGGVIVLWTRKTWVSSLVAFGAINAALIHGAAVRMGEGAGSYAGAVPLVAGFVLAILTAQVLHSKPEVDDPLAQPRRSTLDQAA